MAILKIVACGQELVQRITAHEPQILVLILPFFVQIKQTKYHILIKGGICKNFSL